MAVKLLHGTSFKRLQKIKVKGLRSPYLTDLEAVADFFAGQAAYDDGSTPIVLEVTVLDPDRLRADLEMYADPVTAVFEASDVVNPSTYHQMRRDGDIVDPDVRDWRTSLYEVHSVRHRGPIAPRDIKVWGS